MFNSTLTGNARVWFDDLLPESIDSYDDLKEAFLANYLQQKKCIKDPVEIHHIKQREGESTEDFVRRFKIESRDVKGAPEVMRILGFMHGITNPESGNQERKNTFPPWKQQDARHKQNFKKGGFKNQQRSEKRQDRFALLAKTPKEILALDKGKFKPPPPMTTPVEKMNASKLCEFHGEVGHTTDECMHLKRQIEEMLKAGKLSHLIKELKQNNGKDQAKVAKKGEAARKDKPLAILMVQSGRKIAKQRITQTFSPETMISFPPLGEEDGTEGPMVIEAEVGGHLVHRMYVDGGASSEILSQKKRLSSDLPEYIEQEYALGSTLNLKKADKKLCVCLSRTGYLRLEISKHDRGSASHSGTQVEKLVNAGIMKEVHYHSWLSNPVMVKKHDNSWRMYVDFKDLNKACPKDVYALPEIDWKVESLCGYPFKCFLDAYKGYHQIKMAKEDEEKTAFITSQRILCYSKMSFGLKNAGATYERLVDKAFQKQIGRNLEAYVDDLVIKSFTEQEVEGIFLGYKVNSDGLMVSPDNVEAVLSLPSLKCLKDVQRLNEKLASLNSRALRGPEINYTPMEKLVLALVSASKRLKRYFQEHIVIVITYQQIKQMLSNPEVTGRLLKWSFELEEHDIQYRPRTSVKGQILADFIVEHPEDNLEDTLLEDEEELPDPWTLFTDRSSCADGSGAGLILTNPEGMEFTYALRFRFDATNNEAEYEALIAGLKIAEQMGVENLQENVDSRLVANQVNGTYVAKETDMIRYLEKVKTLTSSFKAFSIKQVPRNENKKADALSKIASTSFAHLSKQVLVEELKEKSISATEVLAVVEEEGDTWMTPIFKYLLDGTLPAEGKKARVVKLKSWRFGLPGEIISDNGKQFQDNPFKVGARNLASRQHFASVKHPTNYGLVERQTIGLGKDKG
ncbi:reverse transcriptase domain-containing protein [Tanacetum coccineum]